MLFFSSLSRFITNLSFRLYHSLILPLRYRVKVVGGNRIGTELTDARGGILFLSSHPSHLDPSIVGYALWERGMLVSFWTVDYVFKHVFARFALRSADTVKLIRVPNVYATRSQRHGRSIQRLIQKTIHKLHQGEYVLFFPGGTQKNAAYEEVNGKSAVEKILKLYPDVNIVLVQVTGMWGSRFSKAVTKRERSNATGQGFMRFLLNMIRIILSNFIFFIPRRNVTIEFTPAGPDFPRHGTRREINQYLETMMNRGYGDQGEPLQKVSDYFWKAKYPEYEYHLKSFQYAVDRIEQPLRDEVVHIVADKAGMAFAEIKDDMLITRDLSLDSLEVSEILVELEKRFHIPKYTPKQISTVGHLVALVARIPVDFVPKPGRFTQTVEEPLYLARAWQVCTGFLLGLFHYINSQK